MTWTIYSKTRALPKTFRHVNIDPWVFHYYNLKYYELHKYNYVITITPISRPSDGSRIPEYFDTESLHVFFSSEKDPSSGNSGEFMTEYTGVRTPLILVNRGRRGAKIVVHHHLTYIYTVYHDPMIRDHTHPLPTNPCQHLLHASIKRILYECAVVILEKILTFFGVVYSAVRYTNSCFVFQSKRGVRFAENQGKQQYPKYFDFRGSINWLCFHTSVVRTKPTTQNWKVLALMDAPLRPCRRCLL